MHRQAIVVGVRCLGRVSAIQNLGQAESGCFTRVGIWAKGPRLSWAVGGRQEYGIGAPSTVTDHKKKTGAEAESAPVFFFRAVNSKKIVFSGRKSQKNA